MYVDDSVCVFSDLTLLPLLGGGRKSCYIIIPVRLCYEEAGVSVRIGVVGSSPAHRQPLAGSGELVGLSVTLALGSGTGVGRRSQGGRPRSDRGQAETGQDRG